MKNIFLGITLTLLSLPTSSLASAPAAASTPNRPASPSRISTSNIEDSLEAHQQEVRCPSPSVNQRTLSAIASRAPHSAPDSSASAAKDSHAKDVSADRAFLTNILFYEDNDEDEQILSAAARALREIDQKAKQKDLPSIMARKQIRRLLHVQAGSVNTFNRDTAKLTPIRTVVDQQGTERSGITPDAESSLLLRKAGLTYTHTFCNSTHTRKVDLMIPSIQHQLQKLKPNT